MFPPPLLRSFWSPGTCAFACSQCFFQSRGVLITAVRVFLQATQNDALKIGWHCFLELIDGNEWFIGMSVKHLQSRLAVEGQFAGNQELGHGADVVNVATGIELLAASRLLRRHESRRTGKGAFSG